MTTEHKQPLVSIDVVPIRFQDGEVKVALGERIFEPFIGALALPGVLLLPNETINDAALRALKSKVGFDATDVLEIAQIGAFDNSDRDPRGPTISISLFAIISDEARSDSATWQSQREFGELPFDHFDIIEAALGELNIRLWKNNKVTKALIGSEFSTAHAIAVTEAVSTGQVDKTNFTRMLKNYSAVEQAEAIRTGRGRPSAGWRFTS